MPNPSGDPDVQLMLELQRGSRDAFRELLERNHQRVLNLAYRYLRDRSLAEDVVQETFLKLYKARERYRPDARFQSYLLRIATNICLSKLRKKGHVSLSGGHDPGSGRAEPEPPDPEAPQPTDVVLHGELKDRIRQAVAQLPDRQRMAILLNKFEGLDYKEVAVQLGLTVPATKSLLHRARMALKEMLAEYVAPGSQGGR